MCIFLEVLVSYLDAWSPQRTSVILLWKSNGFSMNKNIFIAQNAHISNQFLQNDSTLASIVLEKFGSMYNDYDGMYYRSVAVCKSRQFSWKLCHLFRQHSVLSTRLLNNSITFQQHLMLWSKISISKFDIFYILLKINTYHIPTKNKSLFSTCKIYSFAYLFHDNIIYIKSIHAIRR